MADATSQPGGLGIGNRKGRISWGLCISGKILNKAATLALEPSAPALGTLLSLP